MGAPVKNEPGSTAVASRDSFGDALVRLGETHPELVVLEADLSESTRSKKFAKKFPDRFFQMGIAEANMLGVAAGLSLAGPFEPAVRHREPDGAAVVAAHRLARQRDAGVVEGLTRGDHVAVAHLDRARRSQRREHARPAG